MNKIKTFKQGYKALRTECSQRSFLQSREEEVWEREMRNTGESQDVVSQWHDAKVKS